MAFWKNVSSQKAVFRALDSAGNVLTGDAANQTALISEDAAEFAATNDANPTEIALSGTGDDSAFYVYDLTQAETNNDLMIVIPSSSTAGVTFDPPYLVVYPTEMIVDDGTATFDRTTDSLQAIRDNSATLAAIRAGLVLQETTIATLASQTSFTLTAGSPDNSTYVNCTIVVEDASTAAQKAVGIVSAYTGSTKTITLKFDPGIFTMAVTDKIYILGEGSLKSTAQNRQLDVTATGAAGIDWANVENQTTAVDLSATDIQLCDTITTYTGDTVQTGDNFARLGAPAGASVSADIAAVKVDTTAILVDTSTTLDTKLNTIDDFLDTEIAAITAAVITNAAGADIAADIIALKAETVLIVADTGELQTDWVNGGRLDLIVDAILLDTGTTLDAKLDTIDNFLDTEIAAITAAVITNAAGADVAADIIALKAETVLILADTAVIGALGAGLSNIPWNSSWDAEVQSEVDDALIAKGLDHLVFVSVTGTDIADNSVIARLASKSATADWDSFNNTTDSLEAIEDGMGTAGPTAAVIADAIWDEAQADHVAAGSFGITATEIADVLTDTGTTLDTKLNTIDDFLDTEIAAITAAVITNATGADIAADIIALKAETVLIVADTGELQTDWVDGGRLDLIVDAILVDTGTTLDGKLDTIDDFLDTEIAAITAAVITNAAGADVAADIIAMKAETVLIVADTNELQTDWVDGGRLDLIIDAVLVDTAEIGVAGVGLSNIPWNSSWDAEVQSEVDDALIAKGLDHLVFTSVVGADVADNSIIAYIASKSATADWDTFDNDSDSLEGISDGGGVGGASAAQVWSYSSRVLTQTLAQIAAIIAGAKVTIHRGDTLVLPFPGLGDITGRSKIWFTVKEKRGDPADTAALIQVFETVGTGDVDGLLFINGAAAATIGNGSIVVDDAVAGDITITIAAVEVAKLVASNQRVYDVQMVTTGGVVTTLQLGDCVIAEDVSRVTS